MLLFNHLSGLSDIRASHGMRHVKISAAAAVSGMTKPALADLLDRFDAAMAKASAMDRTGMDDASMRAHAADIVRRLFASEPTTEAM